MGYLVPKTGAEIKMIERRSVFIGYLEPVDTEQEAINFINKIRKKHHDATHNVYSYIIKDNQITRYSDDGEPQGTAGVPVLNVLQRRNLYNVVAVVTRYFGGILLGAGGLVRAYGGAASLACDKAGVCEMAICTVVSISCDYSLYGRVQSIISDAGAIIDDTVFEQEVTIRFALPCDVLGQFENKLTEATSGSVSFVKLRDEYRRRDVK